MIASFDFEGLSRYANWYSLLWLDGPQAADTLKCSLAHQLLPKDQQTKPEEVNKFGFLAVRTRSLFFFTGLCIPFTNYQRNRIRIEGARRLGSHGRQQKEEVKEGKGSEASKTLLATLCTLLFLCESHFCAKGAVLVLYIGETTQRISGSSPNLFPASTRGSHANFSVTVSWYLRLEIGICEGSKRNHASLFYYLIFYFDASD